MMPRVPGDRGEVETSSVALQLAQRGHTVAQRAGTAHRRRAVCGHWRRGLGRAASVIGEFLHAARAVLSSLSTGIVALEGIDQPAHFGGDVVEALAHMRVLDAVAVPIGHDGGLRRVSDLLAQLFQLLLDR